MEKVEGNAGKIQQLEQKHRSVGEIPSISVYYYIVYKNICLGERRIRMRNQARGEL